MTAFTQKLASLWQGEYARWDNGRGREAQQKYSTFVKQYWVSIGINNLDGRTVQGGIRPAWSSAFVSFCVRHAGAAGKFRYGKAHCHYIDKAMKAADNNREGYGYIARKPSQYKPKVGDIICAGREYAKRYDYDKARLIYLADSFYPSHGDIVVAVQPSRVKVIGGNINNNVDVKYFALKSNGLLKDRTSRGTDYPWIAVLECVL
jgi:hypothetical protein